ncbi:MAG TPA: DUF2298 domain-containing protein [Anaerolineales bacterium]|nr:DUF2298 domain-containing protein [Anaerolineales bacterium]
MQTPSDFDSQEHTPGEQPDFFEPAVPMQEEAPLQDSRPAIDRAWGIELLVLLLILALSAFFRFRGISWDEFQYLHPDERFLGFVENDIEPVKSLGEYFDTANSTLNPANRNHSFFVYGTLPIFLLQYVMEWVDKPGYGNVGLVGRPLSGLFDLATIVMLYLIASKLFNRRVGLLAAAFSGFAVLQIQLSHFFTVDIFANFFIWLALYSAVVIAKSANQQTTQPTNQQTNILQSILLLPNHPAFVPSLLFGIFSGMALASKISAYPIVLMLPFAAGINLLRQPKEERIPRGIEMAVLMAFAGVLSLLAFRIFQPYAFTGPGFFDVTLNPEWVEAMKSLQNLLQPSIGYPPAVQWIDRQVWFSGYNITAWGLGWPLGLAAWIGMLWMGWRIFRKRDWQPYLVIWAWTTGHFIWVSTFFNPTMRYQLPVYPGLALMAAWGINELASRQFPTIRLRPGQVSNIQSPMTRWKRPLALGFGVLILLATFAYALAFSGIYTRDVTRLAASRWMFRNIPGPINLHVEGESGEETQQPVPFPNGFVIRPSEPFTTSFVARETGRLNNISLGKVIQERAPSEFTSLFLQILASPDDTIPLATSVLTADFTPSARDNRFTFALDQPVTLQEQQYTLKLEILGGGQAVDVCGVFTLILQTPNGQVAQPISPPTPCMVTTATPLLIPLFASSEGALTEIDAASIVDPESAPQPLTFILLVSNQSDLSQPQAVATRTITPEADPLFAGGGSEPSFVLDTPIALTKGETYYLQIAIDSSGGQVRLEGAAIAVESSWDDSLPYRVDNYDPYGGIYQSDLNFEMYWFDDEGKRQRFYDILDGADVVTISSSRQWGSVGRLEAVYPISSAYYRYLLGCPEDRTVEWCYNVAEPGMFEGQLGFELAQTFDANPRLGPIEINDQPSEEAFTVYDHPKVFIFVKTADYDPARLQALLGPLPLGRQLEEINAGTRTEPQEEIKSLLLTPEQLSDQRNGGTWSDLFDSDGVLNTFYPLTVLVWYGAITLLGLVSYPLVRLALPGLDDRGYPLARTAGVLILSYIVWLAGSFEVPVTRLTITGVVLLMVLIGAGLAVFQRKAIRREFAEKWQYFLTIEGVTFVFFLFLLLIRLGNPDLWHPWMGGEKPMDFAYLNAVIRSTTFPPYDPWFAGGYINYYYYGFMFVGVLVKWLGIMPSIAYNLILPTLFSMLAMGVFSIGWNLTQSLISNLQYSAFRIPSSETNQPITSYQLPITKYLPYLIGLAAAVGITVFGNLGTPRMIIRGYERLAAPSDAVLDETLFLTKWVWAVEGFTKVMGGESLPYSIRDWYWLPSRAIPAPNDVEPITEFPFFTFLYADLHAHMIALPITVLALAWVVSAVLARGRWENVLAGALSFLLAGVAIGALRPTNTWDFPTYLALGVVGAGYAIWQGHNAEGVWAIVPEFAGKVIKAIFGIGILILLSVVLYQPFTEWYALGYTDTNIWQGTHTPISAYLTHWGLFLFLIVSWMIWETLDWLAKTPLSALRKLKPFLGLILITILVLLGGIAYLMMEFDASISWLVIILAAWAGVLLLRPGLPDVKRLVLFLVGTGLILTQTVEVIVLSGDIGRMNTVFKFYLQVWILFGVSAAASLGWLLLETRSTLKEYLGMVSGPVRRSWQFVLAVMVFGAAMYPAIAGLAKVKDRMTDAAPHTLDGDTYMSYAQYNDNGVNISLDEDARAIHWLQENVQGSPAIVEAQVVEYRWGSRISINTGLPAVLGWNWHQRQQRTAHDADVWTRANEITDFYNTPFPDVATDFLNRYDVQYIIVGQVERVYYSPEGLAKFDQWNGQLWHEVYRDGQTAIYEVGGS